MTNDPRITQHDAEADFGLLLLERDREDPILAAHPLEDASVDDDALDQQILAGLVAP
jgi:hypothetical protein